MPSEDENAMIRRLAKAFLRKTLAMLQSEAGTKAERDARRPTCEHALHWDDVRNVCRNCGLTRQEWLEQRQRQN